LSAFAPSAAAAQSPPFLLGPSTGRAGVEKAIFTSQT
jgi:hypothetical protein